MTVFGLGESFYEANAALNAACTAGDTAALEVALAKVRGDAPPDLAAEARKAERVAESLERRAGYLGALVARIERLSNEIKLGLGELRDLHALTAANEKALAALLAAAVAGNPVAPVKKEEPADAA